MVEIINATTMATLGYVMGPSGAGTNHAGIEVDDANNTVYVMRRGSSSLYAFDWIPPNTLALKAGYPVTLSGGGGYGIALDESAGILWVAGSGQRAKAYNV